MQDLENSASSDAVVREKIARLPPEVSETSQLEKITSTEDGLKLLTQVNLNFIPSGLYNSDHK